MAGEEGGIKAALRELTISQKETAKSLSNLSNDVEALKSEMRQMLEQQVQLIDMVRDGTPRDEPLMYRVRLLEEKQRAQDDHLEATDAAVEKLRGDFESVDSVAAERRHRRQMAIVIATVGIPAIISFVGFLIQFLMDGSPPKFVD